MITQRELDKYGFTPGCPGCEVKRRGGIAKSGHNQKCRERIEQLMKDDEDDKWKIDQTNERINRHIADKYESGGTKRKETDAGEEINPRSALGGPGEDQMEADDADEKFEDKSDTENQPTKKHRAETGEGQTPGPPSVDQGEQARARIQKRQAWPRH